MTDVTNFGSMTLKTVIANRIQSANNNNNGDLILTANTPSTGATVSATFAHDTTNPSLTFSAPLLLKNIKDPVDDNDAAPRSFVFSNFVKRRPASIPTANTVLNIITDNSTGRSHVWTAADILSGVVIRRLADGNANDVLPSAASVVAALTNPQVGDIYDLLIQKHGTNRVDFVGTSSFLVRGDGGAQGRTRVRINNNRCVLLKIVLYNVTGGNELCELFIASSR